MMLLSLSLFVSLFLMATSSERESVGGHSNRVVCYWGTWANYRPESGKFTPEDVDPSLCTHLIYSFAGLDTQSWSIKPLDPWMDLEDNYGLAGYRKTTDLKYANPELKVSIAIGGWNEGSKKYSEMARDIEKRKLFVASVLAFLQKYNFDGLDLDWEYPAKRGGDPEDKANFVLLVQELSTAFRPHQLLLTAALGAAPATIDAAYDVAALYAALDFVHIMCYDYHGKWDKRAGANAPLFARPDERGQDVFLNVDYTWNYLKNKGAIAHKTVLGVPFYGRAFMLLNPHDHFLGSKTEATSSFQGPFTREDGFLGYNEICLELKASSNEADTSATWQRMFNTHHATPYMFQGRRWVSYDDENSIRLKSEYAHDQNLAGVMVWSIDTDDFRGECEPSRPYPLLRSINAALHDREKGITTATANAESLGHSNLMLTTFLNILLAICISLTR